ncbi:hypothetical protein PWY87_13255 [Kribbella solani]|uniref:hypothetical protein n=1 Tax=Kribbella solani TaxID=236067 RepID=UPI0029A1F912|nr:hypothetical protein [Kribbella solani]MDX2968859.1 hypothetical protein [Kribbella solani]MDX3002648.1 hypothetical protein [Kribbella solani]
MDRGLNVSRLPFVHQKVDELMRQLQVSMREVGKFYGGGQPDRTTMDRARVDAERRGVITSGPGGPGIPVFGADEHRALKDLIAPGVGKRIGLRARGDEARHQEQYDYRNIRRGTMIGALRAVAELAESRSYLNGPAVREVRDAGMKTAVAAAWTAAHYDRVLRDLEGSGKVPGGTAEYLALGWAEADSAERQQLLARVDDQAPAGYAFAEEVGRRAGMSGERTLHWLNNAPPHKTPEVAAGLMMRGSDRMVELFEDDPGQYAVLEGEVSELIRTEFATLRQVQGTGMVHTHDVDTAAQSASGGRRVATLAAELIAHQELALDARVEPERAPEARIMDPRIGVAEPGQGPADAAPTGGGAQAGQVDRAGQPRSAGNAQPGQAAQQG